MLRESSYTAAGDVPAVAVDTPAGRLGLATCYDMRFPEATPRGLSCSLMPSDPNHRSFVVLPEAMALVEAQCRDWARCV